jgi:thioredoxin-related protein
MALAFWLGSPLVERVHSSQSEIAVSADDFFDISFGDLQEELQLVREEGKSALLVMFEMEDCPWCERMKAQVLNRVQVQDYFHENFRIISVDVEGDVPVVDFSGVEMASKDFALNILRVRATPVFVFFDHSGEIITRYTGAVKSPHDFLLLGKFVVEEHFKTKRFNKYRRENQSG